MLCVLYNNIFLSSITFIYYCKYNLKIPLNCIVMFIALITTVYLNQKFMKI